MPTPFMHLEMAEAIQTAVSQREDPNGRLLKQKIEAEWPAFYLGHIAPDFSYLSKLKREETHFYTMPLTVDDDPPVTMLNHYPQLKQPHKLPPSQQLFIAGYLAHLLYDYIWFMEIITPYFWKNKAFGKGTHRRLVHLLLLCLLDADALEGLPPEAGDHLAAAQPNKWLPFGTNAALRQWQQLVADQLKPGAEARTLEIFAPRAELDVKTFSNHFYDEVWMATHVETAVLPAKRAEIKQATCTQSIQLITNYLLLSDQL